MNTAATPPVLARAWLRPSDAALLALAEEVVPLDVLRRDPGLILHFLRYARPTPQPDTLVLDAVAWSQPGLCETAASLVENEGEPLPPDADAVACGLALAEAAERVAIEIGKCSPDAAWCVGLLAGYFRAEPGVARKLLARWRLPVWVTVVVGFPELTVEDAVALGGHRGLLEVIQLGRAARVSGLVPPQHEYQGADAPRSPSVSPNPLWPRILRLAARTRQRSAAQLVTELENRIDALAAQLAESRHDFDTAVRDAKLDGLAEFAAGAGHEINNPLAVIATNVQLLRNEEDDAPRLNRYDAVLRQTRRIQDILTGTRQFARPPRPNPAVIGSAAWVPAVAKELQPAAADAGVDLHLPDPSARGKLWADASHVRAVVVALGRNAVDAAGRGGWVRVRVDGGGEWTHIVVEDGGPGPDAAAVPHLFDPFYSGRNAGRGRGLGLSVAWRLAKQNGGDVRFERAEGVTRFVLTLPSEPAPDCLPLPDRKSA